MRAAIWEGPGLMAMGTMPDPTCPVDGVLVENTPLSGQLEAALGAAGAPA